MTVWTHVSIDELNEWLAARSMPAACSLRPIEDGVEDSVYKLKTQEGTAYCLRLFERTEADGPITLAQRLSAFGLPACPPVKDINGRALVAIKGKQACLYPWIEGAWVERPSLSQIEEIGDFMGRMAKIGSAQCGGWHRENPRDLAWFEDTSAQVCRVLNPAETRDVQEEMAVQRRFWQSALYAHLPRGPVHADLFRNNVMFGRDGKLAAVIDWGFCASATPYLYDFAIVANDWCLTDNGYDMDEKKWRALRAAREAVVPLTAAEEDVWPMMLRLAALRFYLSRLFDYHLPRDKGGRAHDPAYFASILRARKG